MAITIMGVMNGKKYIVLKNSPNFNLLFNRKAINRGIITANADVDRANTIVLIKIL